MSNLLLQRPRATSSWCWAWRVLERPPFCTSWRSMGALAWRNLKDLNESWQTQRKHLKKWPKRCEEIKLPSLKTQIATKNKKEHSVPKLVVSSYFFSDANKNNKWSPKLLQFLADHFIPFFTANCNSRSNQLIRYKKADVTQDMVYLKEVNQDPGYAWAAVFLFRSWDWMLRSVWPVGCRCLTRHLFL